MSQTLEERVRDLVRGFSELRGQILNLRPHKKIWSDTVGTLDNDEITREAELLGRETQPDKPTNKRLLVLENSLSCLESHRIPAIRFLNAKIPRPFASSRIVVPQRLKWHGKLAAFSAFVLIKMISSTWRMKWEDHSPSPAGKEAFPVLFCVWHNRLAISMVTWKHFRRSKQPDSRLAALISASKDGALLARILEYFNVQPFAAPPAGEERKRSSRSRPGSSKASMSPLLRTALADRVTNCRKESLPWLK